ncbi:MAG: hypothetical protein F6K36_17665 [Symploca sp. SIO3C6]|uniref:Uncharacterized protein n=1 Tax=Symploca sp. SIO1C4 TaxID=2607765 RepID=A0A6B3NKG6_9CYAN|nr:hypothetical protein [Symploca sp. SIO3C6]NER30634.1 hypothetical protein [Symploca sp. SIO1C4]NET07256.1 hypothetical protein [Symploca sp. SIO2B6]
MFKLLAWTSFLVVISIVLVAKVAFSSSGTVVSKYPVVPNSESNNLLCYMQTADSLTLDLSSLCEQQSSTKKLAISCPNITDLQVTTRIAKFCSENSSCLASAGCMQVALP